MRFKKLGKMENVVLRSVEIDLNLQYHTFGEGWHFRGTAYYSIGLKHYKTEFLYLDKTNYKVAYLESRFKGYTTPNNRLQNEALLVLIRGEIEKFLGRQAQIQFFKERRKQEQEEERKRKEEEERKRIALGEQVSIDKYLANKGVEE